MQNHAISPLCSEPGWDCIELDAPRNAIMAHPQLVADTLLRIA
jgi:hypothetical protein